jgi:hypothetical protein
MDYSVGDLLAHNTKRHYATKAIAKKTLLRLRSKGNMKKKLYVRSVYKCKVCGEWCLTSVRKNDQY